MINIRPLKLKAAQLEDPLKTLILTEKDEISEGDFFAKCAVWLRLLTIQRAKTER